MTGGGHHLAVLELAGGDESRQQVRVEIYEASIGDPYQGKCAASRGSGRKRAWRFAGTVADIAASVR